MKKVPADIREIIIGSNDEVKVGVAGAAGHRF
jgi:hypothetical protein